MLDLGFLIVVLAILMPFLVLMTGFYLKSNRQKKEVLDTLMQRVGIEASQKQNYRAAYRPIQQKESILRWGSSVLKKAGLQDSKIVIRLLVVQSLLFFFSAYLLSTRFNHLNGQTIIIATFLPFLPSLFIWFKKKQRQNQLRQQFPEMLDAIVRALQSGYGIDGALSMIAEEFRAPLGKEVKEVNRQLTLGISMREILRDFQTRIEIPEAQFFVVTLIIQRETGGQLAPILEELSRLMRRREMFQAKLKTLTAESRFTAIFLGLAPLGYLGYKYFFDPVSMAFFLNDSTGQNILIASLVLMIFGAIILKSMLRMKF
ncbi:type II secretion system protein [Hydrogenovibrio crunogenus]|uniref:Type II secretion system protein n=1 Tax=Hydrogenovibrio crunogenus TaxID=39765 RepID=A0A4P7P175_9GAMM|nr:type II secretion system F family protein [Hydrogenovibrio crunogenus]QBZ83756.1 type II secretion system protein [Hydrogenovibrio crunogenus]